MASLLAPVKAENRAVFTIERILGLKFERPESCLKLHRPWTENEAEKENSRNTFCSNQQQQNCCGHSRPVQEPNSSRPASNWYIGRRPRTAFTNSQVKVLESVFQMNCYPGIQLREQLAERLELDEDRIQIWFQNRRAKLRRSLRESRLRLVQTAMADFEVDREIRGLKVKKDEEVELALEEEEESC